MTGPFLNTTVLSFEDPISNEEISGDFKKFIGKNPTENSCRAFVQFFFEFLVYSFEIFKICNFYILFYGLIANFIQVFYNQIFAKFRQKIFRDNDGESSALPPQISRTTVKVRRPKVSAIFGAILFGAIEGK